MEMYAILVLSCLYSLTVTTLIIMFNKKDKEAKEERTDLINKLIAKNTNDYIKISRKEEKPVLTDADILGDDRMGILN